MWVLHFAYLPVLRCSPSAWRAGNLCCSCSAVLTLACCFAQDAKLPPGSIAGEVFNTGADGQRAVVPGALISLRGPVERKTESDEVGQYRFELLPPGRYTAEATRAGTEGRGAGGCGSGRNRGRANFTGAYDCHDFSDRDGDGLRRIRGLHAIRAIHDDHASDGGGRPEYKRKSREPAAPRPRSGPRARRAYQYERRALHAGRMAGEFRERHRSGDRRRSDEPADRRGVVGAGGLESLRPGVRKIHGRGLQRRNQTRAAWTSITCRSRTCFREPAIRDGDVVGLESVTPRLTVTGPLVKNRVAITQSFEYRFVRTPVQSLPPMQRDMKLESFDSFTQVDVSLSETHSATFSFSAFPEKLAYMGLNTFTPQESTPDLHQHGYQGSAQDRYIFGAQRPAYLSDQLPEVRCRYSAEQHGSVPPAARDHGRRLLRPAKPAEQPFRVAGDLPVGSAAFSRHAHAEGGARLFAQLL